MGVLEACTTDGIERVAMGEDRVVDILVARAPDPRYGDVDVGNEAVMGAGRSVRGRGQKKGLAGCEVQRLLCFVWFFGG